MFEVHDQTNNQDRDEELETGDTEREMCVQLAAKMAACLPNDPALGKSVLEMATTIYAVMTDCRQGLERPLAG